MGLYNFQQRFVPKILSGEKQHTIRAERRYPDEPGDTMHLYTGLRTKKAKLLMRVFCVKVEDIEIFFGEPRAGFMTGAIVRFPRIVIDGVLLAYDECNSFARRDGFENFADMLAFWNGRLPFRGHVYHWQEKP